MNDQPNILILHCDQLRYDALGCHGHPGNPTPHLDALAAKGLDFSRHFTANPVCMPSRASFFTGLHVTTHGVWGNGVPLNRNEYIPFGRSPYAAADDGPVCFPTLADGLAEGGMATAAFGKLHLTPSAATPAAEFPESDEVWARPGREDWHGPYYGFQHVELTHAHGESPGGHYGLWLEREHPDLAKQVAENWGQQEKPVPAVQDLYPSILSDDTHPSFWVARRAGDWIEAQTDPFFAFVGFPDPHHAFVPLQEDLDYFEGVEMMPPVDPGGEGRPDLKKCGQDVSEFTMEEHATVRRYTAAMVRTIDRAIGKLIENLKESGKWENTFVLFTADHGDYLGDHGRLRKCARASKQLLHVPCLLKLPKTIDAEHSRPSRVCSNIDVVPTLLEAAGIKAPQYLQGSSLLSNSETPAFAYGFEPDGGNFSIIDDQYRYTLYPQTDHEELFDHAEDPLECKNLAADPAHQKQKKELKQVLQVSLIGHIQPCAGRVASW